MTQSTDTEIRDLIQALDRKFDARFDAISADLVEIKVTQAKHGERLNTIDKRLDKIDQDITDVRTSIKSTDSRLWGFITALLVLLLGTLGKVFLFPSL